MSSRRASSGRSRCRRSASGRCDSQARTSSDLRGTAARPSAFSARRSRVGVNHIDTAQFYGPDVVNELIREALGPYPPELILVSKVGARRDRRGGVIPDDEPHQLRRSIEENLQTLAVETLPVVNLRLMRDAEPDAFFDDQVGAMVAARDDGLIERDRSEQHLARASSARAPGDADRLRAKPLSGHEPRIAAGARGVHAAGDRVRAVRVARLRRDGPERSPPAGRGRRASGAIAASHLPSWSSRGRSRLHRTCC